MEIKKTNKKVEFALRQISLGLDTLTEEWNCYHIGVGRLNPEGVLHLYFTNPDTEEKEEMFLHGEHEAYAHFFTLQTKYSLQSPESSMSHLIAHEHKDPLVTRIRRAVCG